MPAAHPEGALGPQAGPGGRTCPNPRRLSPCGRDHRHQPDALLGSPDVGDTSSQREETRRQLDWLGGVGRWRCRGVPLPPCPLPRGRLRKSQHMSVDLSRRSKIRLLNSSLKSDSASLRLVQGGFCRRPGGRDFYARGGRAVPVEHGAAPRGRCRPRWEHVAQLSRAPASQVARLRHREAPPSREGRRREVN